MKIDIYNLTLSNDPIPSTDSSPLRCYRGDCEDLSGVLGFDVDNDEYFKLKEEMDGRRIRFKVDEIDSGHIKILIGYCEKAEPFISEVYEGMKLMKPNISLSSKDLDVLLGHYDY